MKLIDTRTLRTLALAVLAAVPGAVQAQSASLGADIVSRYIWRGTDFGESMSVQPALTLGFGGLEAGAWASYSISASGAYANENDLWASYTVETSNGASFSMGFTDYYFPAPDADGFFVNEAHLLELSLGVSGPEAFPVSLFAGRFVRNDPDNSVYLEVGVPVSGFEGVDLGLTAGMVAGASDFYGTEGAALVNLGISASKDMEITESFSLPMSVSYILNPNRPDDGTSNTDRAFLVFGISLFP